MNLNNSKQPSNVVKDFCIKLYKNNKKSKSNEPIFNNQEVYISYKENRNYTKKSKP